MVKIFDLKGADFKFKESLAKLGFKGQALNPLAPIEQDIYDNYAILQNANFKKAEQQVVRWETKLKKLLSHPVGRWRHTRRPGQNKYPMMNSGSLRDSVRVDLKRTIMEKKWVYEFTGTASGSDNGTGKGSSDHAAATNAGLGSGDRHIQWRNWYDELFGMGHSKAIVGARVLMQNIFRKGI